MKSVWYFVQIVVFIALSLVASAETNGDDVKIGSISILTGDGSSSGNAARNGIDLAIERINANGGVLNKRFVAVHQTAE